ncbi:hypothetical protein [Flavobacterium hydrophilum]|uniref:DUF2938 domain-containing protein n=1 Tax=Flavobacterium hydrophilum TaxID=2211445 RepID=A0A2V4C9M0_9FLAO|nr:hypothetical protein [Flavobacterium hydrophilum]PXY46670.1 hypothetical protein DMB68_05765 [Flavobacterium hydrophilum]
MDIYTLLQILLATIAATSAMTLFSYAISASFRELYKEPVLLTFLLTQLKIDVSIKTKATLAWVLHYFIGFIFVLIYHFLWANNILKLSILNAILLGSISGIIGITGWMIMFKLADYKPNIDFKGYYIQLFFAHIIFGLVAALFYYLTLTIILIAKSNVTI